MMMYNSTLICLELNPGAHREGGFPILGLHRLLLLVQDVIGLLAAAWLPVIFGSQVHQALDPKLGDKYDQPIGPHLYTSAG